jgi:pimeloyl-ACP methyl ester carboxylesterase
VHQEIQYCTTSDDVRLAYSVIGKGTPIVRTSHWFSHLEYDLKYPVYRHLILGLAHRHSVVRYDGRGLGLSQRDVTENSFERWISDLECVVDALSLKRFVLFGMSQGAPISIQYAVRHPERVTHLIICGGFARGFLHRDDYEHEKESLELSRALIRQGWGSDKVAYRQWFTSHFIPDATAEQSRCFNEAEHSSATPEMAEKLLDVVADINVVGLLPNVKMPTLILHCRNDTIVPFSLGQELASRIPGAKFVPLEGRNHIILADDSAHRGFLNAVFSFLGDPPIKGALPGGKKFKDQLENIVKGLEQNWFIKLIVILAAITGVLLFAEELWRILRR